MAYKKVVWSAARPKRPSVDPMFVDIADMIIADTKSRKKTERAFRFSQADTCGLSKSTLRNWELKKVKHPSSTSLQMAGKMFGYRLAWVKDGDE